MTSPTYSLYEVYQLTKSINNLEQFTLLEQVIYVDKERYTDVELHNITCLLTSKKLLLLHLDAVEYLLIDRTATQKK